MIKRFLLLLALSVSAFAQTSPTVRVNSLAALQAQAIPTVSGAFSAIVGGTSTNGDQLGGVFVWNATATDATNGVNLNRVIAHPYGAAAGRWIITDALRYLSSSAATAPTNTITGNLPTGNIPQATNSTNLITGPMNVSAGTNVTATGNLLANGIVVTNVGPSVIVRTDPNGNLSPVTIGAGVAFNGTTLSAAGTGVSSFNGQNGALTTGVGLTNSGSVFSGNYVSGSGVTLATNSNGQVQITATALSAPTNTITGTTPLTQNNVPKIDATGTNLVNSVITETNGLVGINMTAPPTEFSVLTSSTADPRGIMSAQYSNDTLGSRLQLRKSRGTVTSPTTIVSGDTLGRIRFSAWDGSAYRQTASIDGVSTGTIGTNRVPSIIQFSTSADSSNSTPVVAMTISTNGNVGIGTPGSSPGAQLYVYGIGQTTAALTDAGVKGNTLFLDDAGGAAGSGGAILFGGGTGTGHTAQAAIKSLLINGTAGGIGDLAFSTRNATGDTALTERMRILSGGNVGIGTPVFGTSAAGVLALGNGTAPSTSPSSEIQMWSANRDAAASTASLHVRTETGHAYTFGDVMIRPGGTRRHYTAATAPYTILITDDYIFNGSNSTNTFSAASTYPAGSEFIIFAGAGVTVTVARTGGDTINGAAANDAINANTAFTYVSDGVSNFQRR